MTAFGVVSRLTALQPLHARTGHSATGPPPAKLRPFSLWPIMAEENENGLFEI